MTPQPRELKLLSPDRLQIIWRDGQVREYSVRELRDNCPCATCLEKRAADKPAELLPILRGEEAQPLRISKMEPLGHYAYSIEFSDGHDTGLFTLELLRELGRVPVD
jgi:DUF971 family protein